MKIALGIVLALLIVGLAIGILVKLTVRAFHREHPALLDRPIHSTRPTQPKCLYSPEEMSLMLEQIALAEGDQV